MADFFRPHSYAMKVDPTLKYAWINIPKNGSSFVHQVLDDNGWNDAPDDLIDPIIESPNVKKLVVLRDPIDRWCSGFAQTLLDRGRGKMLDLMQHAAFWDTIALNPVFDDHTEYQHRFVGNAQNLQYIYMQKSRPNEFYRSLSVWVRSTGGVSDYDNWHEPVNASKSNKYKLEILSTISVEFKKKILTDLHKKDYELFGRYDKFTH